MTNQTRFQALVSKSYLNDMHWVGMFNSLPKLKINHNYHTQDIQDIQNIQECAYLLWDLAGRPSNPEFADQFWYQAESLLVQKLAE
jgi:hypothetical protein